MSSFFRPLVYPILRPLILADLALTPEQIAYSTN